MAESSGRFQKLLGELKRRRVTQVVLAYAVVGFGIMQAADTFFPALRFPDWTVTLVAALVIAGLPVAVVLAWVFDLTPEGVQSADAPKAGASGWAQPRRIAVASVLIVGVAILGGFLATRVSDAGPSVNTVAVLPFDNLSGDPANDYFSDGITEDVLTHLSKVGELKVISRTSATQYKNTKKTIPQIANELRVGAVLEGSVQRVGNHVRITAQLIDASNDEHLWAENYDRDIRDILSLQTEIAQEIAKALNVRLTPAKRAQLDRVARRSVDPHAYEEYLRGLAHAAANRRGESNEHLERALQVDPRHAPAYAAMARNYYFMTFLSANAPRDIAPRLKHAADRALALDPELADAHATRGLYLMHFAHDLEGAQRAFERALELAPSNAQVRHDYAHFLLAVGRSAESAAESVRAAELDPKDTMLQACAGWHRFADAHYSAAVAGASKALMMMPNMFWPEVILGWGYEQSGNLPKAIELLRKAVQHSRQEPFTRAALAHALAVSGEKQEARQILRELEAAAADRYVSAYDLAAVYVGLGEHDEAFSWLAKAAAERSMFLVFVGWDPRFNPLRNDARYAQLERQLGIRTALTAPAAAGT
ncbi:MAG TPA: tetratricopeptide repeat protein [Longimicrobiales bacterium]